MLLKLGLIRQVTKCHKKPTEVTTSKKRGVKICRVGMGGLVGWSKKHLQRREGQPAFTRGGRKGKRMHKERGELQADRGTYATSPTPHLDPREEAGSAGEADKS